MSNRIKISLTVLVLAGYLLVFSVPPAYALDGGAGWVNIGMQLAKGIAKGMANLLITQLMNKVTDKIRTLGRTGGPAFVQDWSNFLAEGEYRGEDKFRSILANTKVCDHLRQDVDSVYNVNPKFKETDLAGVLTRTGSLNPFALRARCTLPDGFNTQAFLENPSENGGWEAFLRLLEPQNNALGLALMADDEIEGQRAAQKEADQSEAESGQGYTSVRDLCNKLGGGARCVILEKIKTPADLISKTSGLVTEKISAFAVDTKDLAEYAGAQAVSVFLGDYIIDKISDFGEGADTPFQQVSTRDQRASEYCTTVNPRPDVDAEFQSVFDTTPGDLGPCPEPKKENIAYVNVCVHRCMQALGLIDPEITIDGIGPPQFAPTPSPGAAPTPAF